MKCNFDFFTFKFMHFLFSVYIVSITTLMLQYDSRNRIYYFYFSNVFTSDTLFINQTSVNVLQISKINFITQSKTKNNIPTIPCPNGIFEMRRHTTQRMPNYIISRKLVVIEIGGYNESNAYAV